MNIKTSFMAEENGQQQQNVNNNQNFNPSKIGKVEAVSGNPFKVNLVNSNEGGQNQQNENQQEQQQQQQQQTPNDEDVVANYFKSKGLDWKGFDDIASRLNSNQQQHNEPTEEEKLKQQQKKEQRRLERYLAKGGKVEDYVSIKAVAEGKVEELSPRETKAELIEAGFTEDQAASIIRERYYMLSEQDIDLIENDDEKEFAKKKAEYFQKKLANRAGYLQSNAKKILEGLDSELTAEDSQLESENKLSSMVEEHFSKLPRELVLELGKVDEQDIDPIKYNISDEEINSVKETLSNPDKRNKLLYREDGSLNIETIARALIDSQILRSATKASYLEGSTRQVKKFSSVFPTNPHGVGVSGGNNTNKGETGKLVSVGKPQVVRPR